MNNNRNFSQNYLDNLESDSRSLDNSQMNNVEFVHKNLNASYGRSLSNTRKYRKLKEEFKTIPEESSVEMTIN